MRGMEPPATTSEAGRHATVRSNEHRPQIDAVGRIAGPTMSSAAAVLLRAIGEAAAMALMCPSTVLKAKQDCCADRDSVVRGKWKRR